MVKDNITLQHFEEAPSAINTDENSHYKNMEENLSNHSKRITPASTNDPRPIRILCLVLSMVALFVIGNFVAYIIINYPEIFSHGQNYNQTLSTNKMDELNEIDFMKEHINIVPLTETEDNENNDSVYSFFASNDPYYEEKRKKRSPSPIPEILRKYNKRCSVNSDNEFCKDLFKQLKLLENDLSQYIKVAFDNFQTNLGEDHKTAETIMNKSDVTKLFERIQRSSDANQFDGIEDRENAVVSMVPSEVFKSLGNDIPSELYLKEQNENQVIENSPMKPIERETALMSNMNNENNQDGIHETFDIDPIQNERSNFRESATSGNNLVTEFSSKSFEHINLDFEEPENKNFETKRRSDQDEPLPIIDFNERPPTTEKLIVNNEESLVEGRDRGHSSRINVVEAHNDRFTPTKGTNFDSDVRGSVTSENMKAASQVIVSSGAPSVIPMCYPNPNFQPQSVVLPPIGGIVFPSSQTDVINHDGISPRVNEFSGYRMPVYQFPQSQPQLYPQPYPIQYGAQAPQLTVNFNQIQPPYNYNPTLVQPNVQNVNPQYICTNVQTSQNNQSPVVSAAPDFQNSATTTENEYEHKDYNNKNNHISSHYRNAEGMAEKIYGFHKFESNNRESYCNENSKMCISDGKCLNSTQWCNGITDCDDGSDEAHCTCKSRILKSRLCDGFYDCPLGEDELGCFNCDSLSFSCNEWTRMKTTSGCFSIEQRCDGKSQCSNNKDEQECTMLHNALDHHATFEISHSKGFLHKNYKGKWYPVCTNPHKWAEDACISEMGNLEIPPYLQIVPIQHSFAGKFINNENNNVAFSNNCLNGSAVYVTCMSVKCGVRANYISQNLRESSDDDEVYYRRKRQIFYHAIPGLENMYDDINEIVNFDSEERNFDYEHENFVYDHNFDMNQENAIMSPLSDRYEKENDHYMNMNVPEPIIHEEPHYVENYDISYKPRINDYPDIIPDNVNSFRKPINNYYLHHEYNPPTHIEIPKDLGKYSVYENIYLEKNTEKSVNHHTPNDNSYDHENYINNKILYEVNKGNDLYRKSEFFNEHFGIPLNTSDLIDISTQKENLIFNSTNKNDTLRDKRGEGRVVGGRPCAPATWPWVVAMYRNGFFHCGGVLLNDRWVLSAAHCVVKYWHHYYEIQAGMLRRFSFSPQEQIRAVSHIKIHELYHKETMINDICLLKMNKPVHFNKWVRPICLPDEFSAGKEWLWGPTPGTLCSAVGWGAIFEHGPDADHLREVEVPILSNCKSSEDKKGQEICAGFSEGGHDACQGDSGGPFLCKNPNNLNQWYLAGIVSHGEGCARAGEPGVYTRVSIFKDWIHENMDDKSISNKEPKAECPGFKCVWGVRRCIPKKLHCDKIVDCLGGEDEVNCHQIDDLVSMTHDIHDTLPEDLLRKESIISYNKKILNGFLRAETNILDTDEGSGSEDEIISVDKFNSSSFRQPELNPTESFQNISSNISKSFDVQNITMFNSSQDFNTSSSINFQNDTIVDTEGTSNQLNKTSLTISNFSSSNGISGKNLPFLDITTHFEIDNTTFHTLIVQPEETVNENISNINKNISVENDLQESKDLKVTTEFNKISTIVEENNAFSTITENFRSSKPTTEAITKFSNPTMGIITEHSRLSTKIITESSTISHNTEEIISMIPPVSNSLEDHTTVSHFPLNTQLIEGKGLDPIFDSKNTESLINKKELDGFWSQSEDFKFFDDLNHATVNKTIPMKHLIKPILPNYFECRWIPQRIPLWKKCDRKADCEDGTDEINCSCADYLTFKHESLICDGYVDCADASDEANCYGCPPNSFQCKISKTCISMNNVCDRSKDCTFGEDEIDCFTLFSGNSVMMDEDLRPVLNNQGILSLRKQNTWHPVCEEHWTYTNREKAANFICSYLGFGGFESHDIVKFNSETSLSVTPDYNNPTYDESSNYRYKRNSETTLNDMTVLIPTNCSALHINCKIKHTGTISSHLQTDNSFRINHKQNASSLEHQDIFLWPWIAKIYYDGTYQCIGVLIDVSWILVENNCWNKTNLVNTYVTAILGTKRSITDIKGPHQQYIRINDEKSVPFSTVTLLHLESEAHVTRNVKPIPLIEKTEDGFVKDERCVAVELNNKGYPITVFLRPLSEEKDCGISNRCFERTDIPDRCRYHSNSNQRTVPWNGILVCQKKLRWYPTASYSESHGECGFTGRVALPNLSYKEVDIKALMNLRTSNVPPATCLGVRCLSGKCVLPINICNGVPDCQEETDESAENCAAKKEHCSKSPYELSCSCSVSELKCLSTGECLPKNTFANHQYDCPDQRDEPIPTTCFSYLSLTAPLKICDGIRHCKDKTDEDPNYCNCYARNTYKCQHSNYCIPHDYVCDGENDCPGGEDEFLCAGLKSFNNRKGTGEVILRKFGIWYPKCYDKPFFTKFELEKICADLGFRSGHALQLEPPNTVEFIETFKVVVDSFSNVSFPYAIIQLRNGDHPYAWTEIVETNENCHRLYIECL